jgi:hypothetical protein
MYARATPGNDGDPAGHGQSARQFAASHLKNASGRSKFVENLACVREFTEAQARADQIAAGYDAMTDEQKAAWTASYYQYVSPSHGPSILTVIWSAKPTDVIRVRNTYETAALSAIPWGYVIDLDASTFAVYRGGNTTPLVAGDLFYPLQNGGPPYPMRVAASWALDDVPNQPAFLSALGL